MAKTDLNEILQAINNHEYEDLDKFLKKTDWFSVPKDSILPRAKVRAFVTSIADDEVRLAVMRFLQKYEDHYFKEDDNGLEPVLGVDPIAAFHKELAVQIEQLTSTGEFSGDKFSRLQKRNEELEKQVDDLTAKQKELENEIDFLKYPYKYGKHIPDELKGDYKFYYIMEYLVSHNVVRIQYVQTAIGPRPCCYYWDKSKALFGYFVVQMNKELDLCASPNQYNWKVFEPAIQNYGEILDEARKAVSKEKKDPKKLKPEGADYIREAIKYAIEKNEDKPKAKIERI